MDEVEILALMASHGDRVWSELQYWTSVSFGLLIAAHIAAAHINKYVLAAFLLLYSLFTASFLDMIFYDIAVIRAGGLQLEMLAKNGEQLSLIAQASLDFGPLLNDAWYDRLLRRALIAGMFFATLVYPIHCYRKEKR